MATNDVYLRPDAGDGTNGVRLRPDAPDGASGSRPLAYMLSAISLVALGFFPAEEIKAAQHDLNAYRSPASVTANGHVIQQHTQVRIAKAETQPVTPDHSNRMFFGRTAPVVVSAGQPFFSWQPPVAPPEAEAVTWRANHNALHTYRTNYQTVGQPWSTWPTYKPPIFDAEVISPPVTAPYRQSVVAAAPQVTQPVWNWYSYKIELQPPEDIRQPRHDLNAYRSITVTANGHVIQQHTNVRINRVDPHPPQYDHNSRLFFGRTSSIPPLATDVNTVRNGIWNLGNTIRNGIWN